MILNSDNIQQFLDLIKQNSSSSKRRKRFFRSLAFVFFGVVMPADASFDASAPDPHIQASAGAGVALTQAHATLNPAAGGMEGGFTCFFAYSRPYGLKELQQSHISVTGSWDKISSTLGAHSCGYEVYRENIFYGGVSTCLLEKIRFGLLMQYADVNIQNYGRAGAWMMDFGGLVEISRRTSIGFTAKNIAGARIGRCREALPRSLQVGAAAMAMPQLRFCVDLFKEVRFPATVRCGAEWQPLSFFALRAGLGTFPFRTAAGLMIQFKSCRFEYGVDNHEVLGLSHQCSISFILKRR